MSNSPDDLIRVLFEMCDGRKFVHKFHNMDEAEAFKKLWEGTSNVKSVEIEGQN